MAGMIDEIAVAPVLDRWGAETALHECIQALRTIHNMGRDDISAAMAGATLDFLRGIYNESLVLAPFHLSGPL
jgi:hypothetical protein